MSYAKLYAAVQQQKGMIHTNWLRDEAIALSHITKVKEQWSSLWDPTVIRGLYIEGPMGPPVPIGENEALIVLARAMCLGADGRQWRRFIYTKELMHVFDEEDEKANDPDKFDRQIEKFSDPSKAMSPQFTAEIKAYWRALGVLCTEVSRGDYAKRLDANEASIEVVAASLHIPVVHARDLFRPDFTAIIQGLL